MKAMTFFSDPVLESMATRRSVSKVGPEAPTDEELRQLLAAVTPVADHKALRPWRLITLRGDDRVRLGEALDAAAGKVREPGESNTKPLRAELLIAVVASPTDHRRSQSGSSWLPPPGRATYWNWRCGRPDGV